ncbi:MAG: branched-chain amino acid ABC transporter permease [Syntrophaceae bacterium]|nr:branched-chain amino acid ABC transporter permease [Syntrophaceae bacterium]
MVLRSKTFVETYREDLSLFRTIWLKCWWTILLVSIIVFPFMVGRYSLYTINLAGIYIIGAIGLNILTGYTGQISIGHAAFIAIGSYTTTILGERMGFLPFYIIIPLSGIIATLIGVLVGLPCLRLKGLYLAMATMSFGIVVQYVLFQWDSLTHGALGMAAPSVTFLGLKIDSDKKFYFLIAVIVFLLGFAAKNMMRMKIGRAFVAIRDRDIAADVIGVDLTRYKVMAFGISSFYAGVSGSLFAYYTTHVNPEYFTIFLSVEYLAMIIVGGMGSILGSILGAMFIGIIPEWLRIFFGFLGQSFHLTGLVFTQQLKVITYGVLIILFLIFESGGLFAIWQRVKTSFKSWPFTY